MLSAIAAGAALACALTAFLGWVLRVPDLRGFGIDIPIWPLTAVGFACLAGAMLALLRERMGIAIALCVIPVLLSVSGVVQALTGYNIGIHGLLFAEDLAQVRATTPGRPAFMILLEWLLFIAAMLLASRKTWRACLAACLIASIPLVLSIMTLGLLLIGFRIPGGPGYFLWSSLPASFATILLSIAIFLWCRGASWTGAAGGEDLTGWTFARVFPILLMLPALAWLFELGAFWIGLDPLFRETLAGALNVLLVGGLLIWALHRTSRQQGALREFAQGLDSAPIAMLDPDGTIVHWSRGCEYLYGWTAREAIGTRKHALLNTKAEGGECGLAELDPGTEMRREVTDTARDGRQIRVLEHARRVDGGTGTPLVILSMTDLTERAQMESELRDSEARLAAAMDAHDLAVFEWDPATTDTIWVRGSERFLGVEQGALRTPEQWQAHMPAEDYAALGQSFFAAVTAKADRYSFRYRFHRPDGEMRWIEGSACCFYDERGELSRMMGIHFDVTVRDTREADLEARRALLRAILDTVPDAMIAFDEQGIIRRFSPGAVKTLGYEWDDAVGQHFTMIAATDRREAYADVLRVYLETGVAQFIGRVSRTFAQRADGTEIPVELRVAEASVAGERLVILFLRDLTETVAYEERLGSMATELSHVSRLSAMGEMAAGMAHELNQPLTAIANYLGTAGVLMQGEGADIGQARAMIETANRQTLRAGQIIRRMRDFAAKKQVDVEAVSVRDTVRDAIALVFVGPAPLEIRLEYDLDPKADTMLADRIQIQQVLVNLLRNALQAMQGASSPVREIMLSVRARGNEMIEIGVCDSGPGISHATRTTLFEPFTASSSKSGMGVGLSICRRIVEAHGGEIWFEDKEGGGAAFRFTVPRFINREDPEE